MLGLSPPLNRKHNCNASSSLCSCSARSRSRLAVSLTGDRIASTATAGPAYVRARLGYAAGLLSRLQAEEKRAQQRLVPVLFVLGSVMQQAYCLDCRRRRSEHSNDWSRSCSCPARSRSRLAVSLAVTGEASTAAAGPAYVRARLGHAAGSVSRLQSSWRWRKAGCAVARWWLEPSNNAMQPTPSAPSRCVFVVLVWPQARLMASVRPRVLPKAVEYIV